MAEKSKRKNENKKSAAKGSEKFKLSKFHAVLFIVIISAAILAFPHLMRYFFSNDIFPGDISYYNARIAESFSENEVMTGDTLSYGGRPYFFDPYHEILAATAKTVGINQASKLLPYIFGILSALLFFVILDKMKVSVKINFLATLIFISSPLFIESFVFSKSISFAILLFLLGLYLFTKNNWLMNLASLIVFLSMPLFGIAHTIASAMLVYLYAKRYNKLKRFSAIFIPILIFSIVYLLPLTLSYPAESPSFITTNYFSVFIAGIGSQSGISVFVIILFLIAFFLTWEFKKSIWLFYAVTLLLIAGVFLDVTFIYYLNIIVSAFAAVTMYFLAKSQWEVKLIKNMTHLVLICGILFSTVNLLYSTISAEPNHATMEAMQWLGYHSNGKNSAVLSHYSNGFWLEYWSEMPVFMDSMFQYTKNSNERYNLSEEIFSSRDLKKTLSELSSNNIKYIYIDQKMKEGEVWSKPDEGMLLLLKDNQSFRNIYDYNGNEIWEVISQ